MTSYITDGTVGPWAKEKLGCLSKYLHAYTQILKGQSWCQGYIYFDAFAGAGKATLRQYGDKEECDEPALSLLDMISCIDNSETEGEEEESYVLGSPRVALEIQNPFTEYIFVEKDPKRVKELKEIKTEYAESRKITILEGDANQCIYDTLLGPKKYNWKKSRAVAFLDPFGMQVPWSTLEAIGKTGAIELILNLPIGMAIQRLLPRSGKFSDNQRKKLDIYFGSTEWEEVVYEHKSDLFGSSKVKRPDAGRRLAEWYQKRLQEAFGYCPKPRLIKNPRGTHLYYVLWAGKNETGAKIAAHVLKQGEAI